MQNTIGNKPAPYQTWHFKQNAISIPNFILKAQTRSKKDMVYANY